MKSVIYARLAKNEPDKLTAQVEMLTEEIEKNPLLELAGVYSEFGGGTGTAPPPEMKKMLEDCVRKDIRLVFMRDTSRLATSFYDLDRRIKLFQNRNIAVWFVSERMSSMHIIGDVPVSQVFGTAN